MLFYRTFGNSNNQPLIFLHGFLGSSLDFHILTQELQKEYFCICLDLPGHGNSAYQTNTLLEVQKTIESLKITPFLIGYSLGGRIALYLSQKTDLSLKGTIILSSHIGLSCPIQKKARLEKDLLWSQKLKTLSSKEFLQDWYKQTTFVSLQKNLYLLQKLLTERLFTNPLELALVLEEMSLAKQPLLNTFLTPTYFLYGEEDIKIKDLYTTISCPKIEIPKAGHVVHLENPKACIKAIQHWTSLLTL